MMTGVWFIIVIPTLVMIIHWKSSCLFSLACPWQRMKLILLSSPTCTSFDAFFRQIKDLSGFHLQGTGVKSSQSVPSRLGLVCPCCFVFVRGLFSTSTILIKENSPLMVDFRWTLRQLGGAKSSMGTARSFPLCSLLLLSWCVHNSHFTLVFVGDVSN